MKKTLLPLFLGKYGDLLKLLKTINLDLKSGEAERCRGSSPRSSAINMTVITSLREKWRFLHFM